MPGLEPRSVGLARLESTHFDILVVGGGITGAGVALDAAARGLSVALIEQADFGEGTSSRSTKLVHGGLRYLPMLDLAQVREDLQERELLLRNAPHLVRPLPFVLPLYTGTRHPLGLSLPAGLRPLVPAGIGWGLRLYDLLAGLRGPRRHRRLSPAAASALVPCLREEGLRRAFLYYDAVTDDAALTMSVLRSAAARGAVVCNYVQAVGVLREGPRVRGVHAVDRCTGRQLRIAAGTVVNATGVWAEDVARLAGPPGFRIRRSKGVHLVVRTERLPLRRTALVLPETDDRRIAFLVPWEGVALLGTTDTEWGGPVASPSVDPADVAYLLAHAARYLRVRLTRADVLGAYAGLRPLVSTGDGKPSARLSRRHAVFPQAPGFVTIVGGKLTTYRRMAEDVVNLVVGTAPGTASPTRALPLDGAEQWREALPALRARARGLGLSRRAVLHLLRRYGTRAAGILDLIATRPELAAPLAEGHPHVAAEVVVAAREEMAVTVADVLVRRTRLALLLPGHGLEIAPRVASLMGEELGWSREIQAAEAARYADVARSLALPEAPALGA